MKKGIWRVLFLFVCGAMSLLLSTTAHSFGLGDIQVNSNLGERLEVEIELISIRPEDVSSIKVNLASRADYALAEITYPDDYNNYIFSISESSSGFLVSITSPTPVYSPFLRFLVELNWLEKTLLREYVVLLDLP